VLSGSVALRRKHRLGDVREWGAGQFIWALGGGSNGRVEKVV